MDDPLPHALPSSPSANAVALERLIDIMAQLRHPVTGCPWDREQDFKTISRYTIEEAYEVAEAAHQDDMPALQDELGDLLLQVVFHARMAEEIGAFDFAAVADTISDKMIRRHPHLFGDQSITDADSQTVAWERIKTEERAAKAANEDRRPSVLDGIATSLPAPLRAVKLQKRLATVGFDWPQSEPVIAKIIEELEEVRTEMAAPSPDSARLEDEIGDLLFACVNLARHLKVDPEAALAGTNRKVERRFRGIEALLSSTGKTPDQVDLAELETLWQQVKQEEMGK
jgi:MazG family protein